MLKPDRGWRRIDNTGHGAAGPSTAVTRLPSGRLASNSTVAPSAGTPAARASIRIWRASSSAPANRAGRRSRRPSA